MHPVVKFGIIESLLWGCAVGAFANGLEKITGKVLLLSACVLVGVLLAVYGQIYQTGADAWPIYAIWAALIFPWVSISRFFALWVFWLAVSNVALILFWFQADISDHSEFGWGICLLLAMLNAMGLLAREVGLQRGVEWLRHRWGQQVLWLVVVVPLTIPSLLLIIAPSIGGGLFLGAIGLAIGLVVGQYYFRYRRPDLFCLGLNVSSVSILLLAFLVTNLGTDFEEAADFLLTGLLVLGVSTSAAFVLRRIAGSLEHHDV